MTEKVSFGGVAVASAELHSVACDFDGHFGRQQFDRR